MFSADIPITMSEPSIIGLDGYDDILLIIYQLLMRVLYPVFAFLIALAPYLSYFSRGV